MYQKLYLSLFNRVTDAIRALETEQPVLARQILIQAQQDCEELYLKQSPDDRSNGQQ